MLTLDTQALSRHAAMLTVERTRQVTRDSLASAIDRASELLLPDGKVDVTAQDGAGRMMSTQSFCQLLKQCNSNFFFEVSVGDPTKMGCYMMLQHEDPIARLTDSSFHKRFVVGMENGWMPEFSIRRYVEKDMPDPENPLLTKKVREFTDMKRGWRSVLVILLRRRMLTVNDIETTFPTLYRESKFYWQETT